MSENTVSAIVAVGLFLTIAFVAGIGFYTDYAVRLAEIAAGCVVKP